jgi:hypothetical protein
VHNHAAADNPGGYRSIIVRAPVRRKISAAPFRDRVVRHALCRVAPKSIVRGVDF